MNRRASIAAATIAAVALATSAATTDVHAAAAAGICKSFSAAGVTIEWSAIGNVTCQEAQPWLLKILAKAGTPDAKVTPSIGQKGFHCSATDNGKGRATAGACYTGTIAFPKNGFQWFG
jgi:hypothetical protein